MSLTTFYICDKIEGIFVVVREKGLYSVQRASRMRDE